MSRKAQAIQGFVLSAVSDIPWGSWSKSGGSTVKKNTWQSEKQSSPQLHAGLEEEVGSETPH